MNTEPLNTEPINTELEQLRRRLDRAERRARLSSACALGALALTGLISVRPAALAQSPGSSLASLVARISTLETTVSGQGTKITNLQNQQKTDETHEQNDNNAVKTQEQNDIKDVKTQEQNDIKDVRTQEHSDINTEQTRALSAESALSGRDTALETKTAPLTLSDDPNVPGTTNSLLTITGVNVRIVNGLGATGGNPQDPFNVADDSVVNGLGNLIIGYNDTRGGIPNTDVRTGSHNLILGTQNNYSSFGGIVTGYDGELSGEYGTVLGGVGNQASGKYSTVTGGQDNNASGQASSVSGGQQNAASNFGATVSGGAHLNASGTDQWKGGGYSSP